ncbi:CPBP family intramembrane metalloprotease [Agrobacterium tumefaciens]|nr:CPBP family intramembrane metalloprotease [Agrobacterium tumefaciens]NTE22254.1 CPBP family intramembrane metalloprotease [Agrobacterium tumefaciens]
MFEEFLIVIIIAPIIETLIFQYLLIETMLGLKLHPWLCIIVSGSLFGTSHWFNWAYILALSGVGFMPGYYYLALKKQYFLNKLVFVILIHALSNTIACLEKNYYELLNQIKH